MKLRIENLAENYAKEKLQAVFDQQSGSSVDNSNKVDQIFKTLDSDGDNKITKAELSARIDKLGDQQSATAQTSNDVSQIGSAGPSGARPPHGGDSTSDDPNQVYESADTNFDGKVSLKELVVYQAKQAAEQSAASSNSQNILDAVLRIANQLALTYGQLDQASSAAASSTAIATTA